MVAAGWLEFGREGARGASGFGFRRKEPMRYLALDRFTADFDDVASWPRHMLAAIPVFCDIPAAFLAKREEIMLAIGTDVFGAPTSSAER